MTTHVTGSHRQLTRVTGGHRRLRYVSSTTYTESECCGARGQCNSAGSKCTASAVQQSPPPSYRPSDQTRSAPQRLSGHDQVASERLSGHDQVASGHTFGGSDDLNLTNAMQSATAKRWVAGASRPADLAETILVHCYSTTETTLPRCKALTAPAFRRRRLMSSRLSLS